MDQSKNMVTILLVTVAVLLAAIAGILVWQNTNDSLPAPTVSTDAPTGTTIDPTVAVAPEFDPETAPVVPADQTPEQFVTGYYEACQAAEWEKAFYMLPTDKQAYYESVDGFASALMGYGVESFDVQPQVVGDGTISVVGTQQAQGMAFPYTWVFVQGADGQWLCQARNMGGQ
ncbi:MAG: hypothetical protein PF636_02710 [Actinomycetota bacterium]|nr:hypothetical protein [Actinomycetota bacterium]